MTRCLRFVSWGTGALLALGLSGCIRVVNEPTKPDQGVAIAASALQRDDGKFVIDDAAVDSISRQADVTSEEVRKAGFLPGHYTKHQVDILMLKLRADEEQYLLSTIGHKLAGSDGNTGNAPAATNDSSVSFKDSILAWARDRFKKPDMTISEVWKKREATLRTVAAKDAARQWVLARVTSHEFNSAISLTVEVVSTNAVPLLASQRAYLSIDHAHQLALTRKRTSCNDAGTACRYVFSRTGKEWDKAWQALIDQRQERQSKENLGETLEPCAKQHSCRESIEFQMQVGGQLMHQTILLAYLNVANQISDTSGSVPPPPPPPPEAASPEEDMAP